MSEYFEEQLNKLIVYQQLKCKCENNNHHEVLALVAEVGTFAVERLKTVIKNMPEFTLHDDTHIFNMLTIIGKIIPQENMKALSAPDLFMLIISAFLHDIGMAPDEKYILAWKNQLPEEEYDEELKEEREKFSRFRLTYTHQLADIERLIAEKEFSKAQLLEDYIVTEYIRTTHSIRAREIIATYWAGKIVYQDTDLTEELATICYSHNESYTYLLQMESFRVCGQDEYLCIPFVATILRLADIIDFDPKRTPSVLFSHLAVKNPVSLNEWKKHQSINAWTISPKRILFSAQCEHPAIEATILAFCNQIDEELDLSPLLDYSWNNTKNIRKIDIDLTCEEYGFKGRGCIGLLIKNDMPVEEIEILSKDVEIDGEIYTLSSSVKYKNNCITETSTSISVDEDGEIDTNTSWSERFKSKSSLSIHGIEVPYNLFPNYSNKMSKAVLNIPFPFSFRLDIGVNSDLNLNSARDQIIYDEKWLTFEENLYQVICKRLKEQLSLSDWERLNEIIQKNGKNIFSRVANNIE